MQEQVKQQVVTVVNPPAAQDYKTPDVSSILARPVAAQGKVRVVNGANQDYYNNLVGKKVSQVRKSLKNVYNISDQAQAYVNGDAVTEDFILADGQQLEFMKAAGTKGLDVTQLIDVLSIHQNIPLRIRVSDSLFIPDHFHITEVGIINKTFIDCGGTLRTAHSCLVQVWIANDTEHRLGTSKFSEILKLAESKFPTIGSLPVEFEYGNDLACQYLLAYGETNGEQLTLALEPKKTDCLAKDKCGVNSNCC